jgi:Endonuclease/Exonuclease/phosphatase family
VRSTGSFSFDSQSEMLDQFLINKNMATGDAPIKLNPATVQILKPPAMVNPGIYPKPIPFGGMADPVNQNGFSDHFPITIRVTEID